MRWVGLPLALLSLAAGQDKPPAMPTCPKDWRVDIVAQVPRIEHPSVVCCSPDGRVFVGIDPMDMRGPSDKPSDSIVCIHPDGRVTVFASRLHAVYGMLYLDGKLYVHHCPKFSVFVDDDGVGKDRVDLLETTNPNPTQGGFNDHLPSQVRMGMDGWLYLTTGDKGIFGCVGKDGRKFELRGGGIFRMRPDGTGLELYASGTRNHLDVAINDEDEMFTYDNTDDGLGWWTRVTHMIDGGFYGYPWDYKPRRPYTLWMMADYGGGSGCGALCYNEDALPDEYHGNLFFCEWTRGQLLRLKVARDGGTYRIASRQDFSTGPSPYRPLGLAVSPDGLSLYLTDWNYPGWMRPDRAGRLFKFTYTGKSQAAPKPDWFVAAAMGRKFKASTAELVEALKHPAQSVRLVAQRRLAERKEAEPVIALLRDKSTPAYARWHAVWTLDAMGAGLDAILEALQDPAARGQAARALGTRRVKEAIEPLGALLKDPDPVTRQRAAIALGRIGGGVEALVGALDEKDFFTRYSMFKALNRVGRSDSKAWASIAKGLQSRNPSVREATLFAMRETHDIEIVKALGAYLEDVLNPGETRAGALALLAAVARKEPPWNGLWWGIQPAAAPRPARTVDWEGTPAIQAALRTALKDLSPDVRRVAIENARDPGSAATLRELFTGEPEIEIRRMILRNLGRIKDGDSGPLVASILKDRSSPLLVDAVAAAGNIGGKDVLEALTSLAGADLGPEILIPCLQALGILRAAGAVPAIVKSLGSENGKVCTAAVNALAQIGGESTLSALLPLLSDDRRSVRRSVVTALGLLKATSAIPQLVKAHQDKATRGEAIEALAKMPDARALDAYLDGLGGKNAAVRDACRKAIAALGPEALTLIESKMESTTLAPQVIDELQRLFGLQPILDWKVLGPFPNPTEEPFDLDKIPDEVQGHRWTKAKAGESNGHVDLGAGANVTAYAATEIDSEAARETVLIAGSDDSLTLWLNGKKIFEDPTDHAWSPDMFRVRASLKAGKNVLVAKIGQHGGEWGFSVAVLLPRKGRLFETASNKPDANAYAGFALSNKGDVARGRALFADRKGMACAKCHRVAGDDGGDIGPDLSAIGAKYGRAELIESVLLPSKMILDGYQQTIVVAKDGRDFRGVVRGETEEELTLVDTEGAKTTIKKADVKTRKLSAVSLMPESLANGLSLQEFADLIDYLQSLK